MYLTLWQAYPPPPPPRPPKKYKKFFYKVLTLLETYGYAWTLTYFFYTEKQKERKMRGPPANTKKPPCYSFRNCNKVSSTVLKLSEIPPPPLPIIYCSYSYLWKLSRFRWYWIFIYCSIHTTYEYVFYVYNSCLYVYIRHNFSRDSCSLAF